MIKRYMQNTYIQNLATRITSIVLTVFLTLFALSPAHAYGPEIIYDGNNFNVEAAIADNQNCTAQFVLNCYEDDFTPVDCAFWLYTPDDTVIITGDGGSVPLNAEWSSFSYSIDQTITFDAGDTEGVFTSVNSDWGEDTFVDTITGCGAAVVCGDGVIGNGEDCDDNNTATGDGCDDVCGVENGFTCVGEPSVCTEDELPLTGGLSASVLGPGVIDSLGDLASNFGPIILLIIGFAVGLYGVKLVWGILTNFVRSRYYPAYKKRRIRK